MIKIVEKHMKGKLILESILNELETQALDLFRFAKEPIGHNAYLM